MKDLKYLKYLLFAPLLAVAAMVPAQTSPERGASRAQEIAPCGPKTTSISPSERRVNRSPDGSPLDPLVDFRTRLEREAADQRFADLRSDSAELADLSWKVSEDIEKGGRNVISARIFERLDRMEKLVKKMRDAAK